MQSDNEINLWKRHINAGNESFTKHQTLAALAHYHEAISQAEYLLTDCSDAKAAVAAMVVSYHNLADIYLREGEPILAECELENVHRKLSSTLKKSSSDSKKVEALLWGMNCTHFALTQHRAEHSKQTEDTASSAPNLFQTTFKNTLN